MGCTNSTKVVIPSAKVTVPSTKQSVTNLLESTAHSSRNAHLQETRAPVPQSILDVRSPRADREAEEQKQKKSQRPSFHHTEQSSFSAVAKSYELEPQVETEKEKLPAGHPPTAQDPALKDTNAAVPASEVITLTIKNLQNTVNLQLQTTTDIPSKALYAEVRNRAQVSNFHLMLEGRMIPQGNDPIRVYGFTKDAQVGFLLQ